MRVRVEFVGQVLRPSGGREAEVEMDLPDGATVRDLLVAVGYRPAHVRFVGVFREGRRLPLSGPLEPGWTVALAVAMGGG